MECKRRIGGRGRTLLKSPLGTLGFDSFSQCLIDDRQELVIDDRLMRVRHRASLEGALAVLRVVRG